MSLLPKAEDSELSKYETIFDKYLHPKLTWLVAQIEDGHVRRYKKELNDYAGTHSFSPEQIVRYDKLWKIVLEAERKMLENDPSRGLEHIAEWSKDPGVNEDSFKENPVHAQRAKYNYWSNKIDMWPCSPGVRSDMDDLRDELRRQMKLPDERLETSHNMLFQTIPMGSVAIACAWFNYRKYVDDAGRRPPDLRASQSLEFTIIQKESDERDKEICLALDGNILNIGYNQFNSYGNIIQLYGGRPFVSKNSEGQEKMMVNDNKDNHSKVPLPKFRPAGDQHEDRPLSGPSENKQSLIEWAASKLHKEDKDERVPVVREHIQTAFDASWGINTYLRGDPPQAPSNPGVTPRPLGEPLTQAQLAEIDKLEQENSTITSRILGKNNLTDIDINGIIDADETVSNIERAAMQRGFLTRAEYDELEGILGRESMSRIGPRASGLDTGTFERKLQLVRQESAQISNGKLKELQSAVSSIERTPVKMTDAAYEALKKYNSQLQNELVVFHADVGSRPTPKSKEMMGKLTQFTSENNSIIRITNNALERGHFLPDEIEKIEKFIGSSLPYAPGTGEEKLKEQISIIRQQQERVRSQRLHSLAEEAAQGRHDELRQLTKQHDSIKAYYHDLESKGVGLAEDPREAAYLEAVKENDRIAEIILNNADSEGVSSKMRAELRDHAKNRYALQSELRELDAEMLKIENQKRLKFEQKYPGQVTPDIREEFDAEVTNATSRQSKRAKELYELLDSREEAFSNRLLAMDKEITAAQEARVVARPVNTPTPDTISRVNRVKVESFMREEIKMNRLIKFHYEKDVLLREDYEKYMRLQHTPEERATATRQFEFARQKLANEAEEAFAREGVYNQIRTTAQLRQVNTTLRFAAGASALDLAVTPISVGLAIAGIAWTVFKYFNDKNTNKSPVFAQYNREINNPY